MADPLTARGFFARVALCYLAVGLIGWFAVLIANASEPQSCGCPMMPAPTSSVSPASPPVPSPVH